jgi:molecular chaperone GrpE
VEEQADLAAHLRWAKKIKLETGAKAPSSITLPILRGKQPRPLRGMTMEEKKDTATENNEVEEDPHITALRAELEATKSELERQCALAKEYLDAAKRVQADFDNYRKRALKEREEFAKSANEKVVSEILTIVDDFERALLAQCGADELREGLKRINDNLLALLRSYGLKEIPNEGAFNPIYHEALSVGEGEEGTILEVYQKGYFLGPRVLRHSKVKVAQNRGERIG